MKSRRIELWLGMVLIGTVRFLASSAYWARMPGQFVALP